MLINFKKLYLLAASIAGIIAACPLNQQMPVFVHD
jgi:hypothetical protein